MSIGMPVYNGERFISEACDSLLAQTVSDFELIISDNASNDATEHIARQYAARHPRIRYVRQVHNRGALLNFEFVLNQAVGHYFMWAAHDDAWKSTFVEKCVTALEQDRSLVAAFSRWMSVSRRLPFARIRSPLDMAWLADEDWQVRLTRFLMLPNSCHKANIIHALWRLDRLREIDFSRVVALSGSHGLIGQDIAFIALALSFGSMYIHPEVLFIKKYKYSPPGHWSDHVIANTLRLFRGDDATGALHRREARDAKTKRQALLKRLLTRPGLDSDAVATILDGTRIID